MAEIPPKTDGRKPAAATCAHTPVPDGLGTESTPLVLIDAISTDLGDFQSSGHLI